MPIRRKGGVREREKNRSVVGDVTLTTVGRGGPTWCRRSRGAGGWGEVERLSMMSLTTRPYLVGTHEKGYTISGGRRVEAYQEQGKGWNTSTAILSRFKHRPRAPRSVLRNNVRETTRERRRSLAKWPHPPMGPINNIRFFEKKVEERGWFLCGQMIFTRK